MLSCYRSCSGEYYDKGKLIPFTNALFHCWGHFSSEGSDGTLVVDTIAIIELSDGKIVTPAPDKIKFEDRKVEDPAKWINPPIVTEEITTNNTEEVKVDVSGITVEEIRQIIMADEALPKEERDLLKEIDEKELAYLIVNTISASLVNSAKAKQEEQDGTEIMRQLQQIKKALGIGKAYCPKCCGPLLVREGQVICQSCGKDYGDIDTIMMH